MNETSHLAPNALIVGCGYLGLALASELLSREITVFGTTRHSGRGKQLHERGIQPLYLSVTDLLSTAALKPAASCESLDLYYMVPPGRMDGDPPATKVVIEGLAHVLGALDAHHVRRAVLVSSTAVYGQSDGSIVTADTPAQPNDPRGELLLQGEELFHRFGAQTHVVRLAGIYGPGRIVGQRAIAEGAPLIGDPDKYLNLIHVEDAARLLIAMMASDQTGPVELGCDGAPVKRSEYYTYLADLMGMPHPRVMDDEAAAKQMGLNVERLRRASSKRCDHGPTIARTGWTPRVRSYREGLASLIG